MSSEQYLERHASGICFVRLYVPARLKAAVGKGEIHRTTGCRDYRLAKVVAAKLAAHWHRSIQAQERMDIPKVKAGSSKLLWDGLVALSEAATELGTTQLALATQLTLKNANFFVEANAVTRRYRADVQHRHRREGAFSCVGISGSGYHAGALQFICIR